MADDVNWPWRLNDTREHGWHLRDGRDCFGPLPAEMKLSASAAQFAAQARPEVAAARALGEEAARAERRRYLMELDAYERKRGS